MGEFTNLMIWFMYLAVAAAGMLIHLWRDQRPRTPLRIVEVILLYLPVIFVGVGGLMGAVGQPCMPEKSP